MLSRLWVLRECGMVVPAVTRRGDSEQTLSLNHVYAELLEDSSRNGMVFHAGARERSSLSMRCLRVVHSSSTIAIAPMPERTRARDQSGRNVSD